jgi:peptidoglycan glycosyltransferase
VNTPIRRLAAFCMVLFLALLLNVTYLQYVTAGDLNDRNDNRRARDAEYSRERGAILVADDPVAESVPVDDRYKFQRRYPAPFQYAHVTGFFSYLYGSDAIELTQNDILSGSDSRLFVDRLVDMVKNTQPQGGSVTLTIDPAAQKAAYDGLLALGATVKGAVVALEPSSGKVLALVSSPSYDPRQLASHDFAVARRAYERLSADEDGPLRNRASREILPPGSTFKLVTAAAALESGDYDPDTLVPGGAALDLPQTDRTLPNEGGGTCGGDRITLTQALMVSCNVAFGSVGLDLGADALREQAEKFGFNRRYFPDINRTAVSVFPQDPDPPQTALSAIGQFEVAASPLQMAMVAAGIANGGEVMEPFLVDEVRAPDLSVLEKTDEQVLSRAVSPAVSRELTQMMIEVVDQGTGTTAQIPDVKVAGKTGTAQSEADRPPYAWFVSFAPADAPEVAVAVLVEDAGVARDAISGSGLAAPIAKSVMEAVIQQ